MSDSFDVPAGCFPITGLQLDVASKVNTAHENRM